MNPEMQQPLKQVIYPSVQVAIVPTPDGVILQMSAPGSGEILIFPMSAEAAREIGQKLSAPHLDIAASIPPSNGQGH